MAQYPEQSGPHDAGDEAAGSLPSYQPDLQGYEVLQVLGSGGAGVVYQAREAASGELCAVEEFTAAPMRVQSFFRELSSLFTLRHPNIIGCRNLIYGSGRKHYLVLEYADGGSLRRPLDEGRSFTVPQALSVIRQVTAGLLHAHEAGLVHRDIKPDNILICRDASSVLYKLSDLATACRLTDDEGRGRMAGTPAYMAPEQFYDQAVVQSDLYSLGVTLFELLTLQRPFDGPPERLFTAHQHQAPPLELIDHEGCRSLLTQLLAKSPADRFENAQIVLDVVESLLLAEEAAEGNANQRGDAGARQQAPTELNAVDSTRPTRAAAAPEPPASTEGPVLRQVGVTKVQLAERLLLMRGSAGATVLVTEPRWTDALALDRNSYTNHRYTDRLLCGRQCDDGHVLAVTPRHVVSIQPGTGQLRRLFAHNATPAPRAFAVSAGGSLMVCADDDRVFSVDASGGVRWSVRLRSYVFSPSLAVLEDDTIAAASGPMGPHVRLLNAAGKAVGAVSCHGPVLGLFRGSQSRLQVLTQGHGATPAYWMNCAGSNTLEQVALPQMVYGGASLSYEGNHFATWAADDWLRIHDAGGRVVTQRRLEGNVISHSCQPVRHGSADSAMLALLVRGYQAKGPLQLVVYTWRPGNEPDLANDADVSGDVRQSKGTSNGMSL